MKLCVCIEFQKKSQCCLIVDVYLFVEALFVDKAVYVEVNVVVLLL